MSWHPHNIILHDYTSMDHSHVDCDPDLNMEGPHLNVQADNYIPGTNSTPAEETMKLYL